MSTTKRDLPLVLLEARLGPPGGGCGSPEAFRHGCNMKSDKRVHDTHVTEYGAKRRLGGDSARG